MADDAPQVDVNDVCELVRDAENKYTSGETTISKYVQESQYETLNKIDAYLNSKHTKGDTDSQGREKPFFNIVTAAVNIWYRATDIDRKNLKVKAGKALQDIPAFMATVWLQGWMKRNNFGKFLNQWGRTMAKYGSAVTKFVVQNGKLIAIVVPWNRLITDTISFSANPVIEVLEMTAGQLRSNKNYNQDMVEKLITAAGAARTDLDGDTKDNKNDYFKLYEAHGLLPVSYKTGREEDKDDYRDQMHVVSFVAGKDEGSFDDFTLFSGFEAQSPYQKDDLIEEDDKTLAIGAVQNMFESQWMVNHSMKNIKDQLDLASKLIFQTADGNFEGTNALAAIQTGDVLVHAANMPLTQVDNTPRDVPSQMAFLQAWKALGTEINGISEAMLGKNPTSGTAWHQTQALLNESQSLFELMTENKGLAIEQMLRKFILPFAKKQMDNADEISGVLESYGLNKIDSMFIPNEAIRRHNKIATGHVLNGDTPPQFDPASMQAQVRNDLSQQGNQRFFKPSDIPTKTWKSLFKDLEWELDIDVTGEQKDVAAAGEAILSALKVYTSATPEQLQDPTWRMAFNKMLDLSGEISPIEIASTPPAAPAAPQNKVSESMSFKDLPPEGQVQMAAQANIKINPPQPPVPAAPGTQVPQQIPATA